MDVRIPLTIKSNALLNNFFDALVLHQITMKLRVNLKISKNVVTNHNSEDIRRTFPLKL